MINLWKVLERQLTIERIIMTSVQELRIYLQQEGIPLLSKAEQDLRRISFNQLAQWEGLKLSLSHFLNTLYFEMVNCMLELEEELEKIRSGTGKTLLDDLKKDSEMVLGLREEVLTTGNYTNKELFALLQQRVQQEWIVKIEKLRKALQDYAEELEAFEQEFVSASALLKHIDDYILQMPEIIGKMRLEINSLTVDSFLSQKEKFVASLEDLSQQIKKQQKNITMLRNISTLRKVLATLQLARINLLNLAKTVHKADPEALRRSTVSFEVFKKQLLEDLEEVLKVIAVAADDLGDAQKRLAV